MQPTETPDPTARRDTLASRLMEATLGLMDLGAVHIGDRLGLYRGLQRLGRATAAELAAETGTQERYVREWLEQQAVSGLLEVDDAGRPAEGRRYLLPAGHDAVLVDPESLATMTPLAQFSAPGDQVERLMYGFSVLCCLPAGMADQPSAATGTVMRTDTLRRYAAEAGFRSTEVLPMTNDLFRFYRLRP